MKQQTFSDIEYSGRKRKTKREYFLDIMEDMIPWGEWVELIKPLYFKGNRGRPPRGIEIMLRMYLLQCWFNLSDEGVEDAICDSYAFRKFMGINFMEEQAPDATTLLHFRHLLEESKLGEAMFKAIQMGLEHGGCIMHGGTIVDASIINAPSSTKNAEKARDPEMHQTKKGKEWRFGMKTHISVNAIRTISQFQGKRRELCAKQFSRRFSPLGFSLMLLIAPLIDNGGGFFSLYPFGHTVIAIRATPQ